MKTETKLRYRIISLVLTVLMLCSTATTFVFAAPDADVGSTAVNTVESESENTAEPVEKGSGDVTLMATSFLPPAKNLAASAFQLKVSDGATSFLPVTNTAWNSTSNSGVMFFYELEDDGGGKYSNNMFGGDPALPSGCGEVSYCYVTYAEDPDKGGKGLDNVVPIGMTQESWLAILKNYEEDPTHMGAGAIDYTDLLLSALPWVSSSNTTLPLATTNLDGVEIYEAQYDSVFLKWEMDGLDPVLSTDNTVVYVHPEITGGGGGGGTGTGGEGGGGTGTGEGGGGTGTGEGGGGTGTGEGGGGTGTGGEGGGGTGTGEGGGGTGGQTSTTGFVTPASDVSAEPYLWKGSVTHTTDVELDHITDDPCIYFYYTARDAENATFGTAPGLTELCAADGAVEYVFVYSDTPVTPVRTITSMTPFGMTPEEWQTTVEEYETAVAPNIDYEWLLETLDWRPAYDNHLMTLPDETIYGRPVPGGLHYSERYYSVFVRWIKDDEAIYNTSNAVVYLHEKEPDPITLPQPVTDGHAYPYLTATSQAPVGAQVVVSKSATETGIDYRYTFTDSTSTVWSNLPNASFNPVNERQMTVEYLWTYCDESNQGFVNTGAGMIPVGMSMLDWNTMRNDYMTEWMNSHSGNPRDPRDPGAQEVDYSDLILDLPGWTSDPVLPLFDDEQVYGAGNGRAGQYTSRYYSCMMRVRFHDGSLYRRAFLNETGSFVHIIFGDYGLCNGPVTMDYIKLEYWDTAKSIWDGPWTSFPYATVEGYTDFYAGYSLTDRLGQQYGSGGSNHFALPDNAHLEVLWSYIDDPTITTLTYYPQGFEATPVGMTNEEWHAMTDGLTNQQITNLIATLPGWTSNRQLPLFSIGEREGTQENRGRYDDCRYHFYARLVVDGAVEGYYVQGIFTNVLWSSALIYPVSQNGPGILYDRVFTIGESEIPSAISFDATVSCAINSNSAAHTTYQWYECTGRDSDGTPMPGETNSTLVITLEPDVPFNKYYYCRYTYDTRNGRSVHGRSNAGLVCVTEAPTGRVEAAFGQYYYGPDKRFERCEDDFTALHGTRVPHSNSGVLSTSQAEFTTMQTAYQTVGSETTLSAYWYCTGSPFSMTWQWYVSDSPHEIGEPIGTQHTVFTPIEEGADLPEANRKVHISMTCPADEVGDKYYRVVCTNYAQSGAFFSCRSTILHVVTLPASDRDELFEVDENGRLLKYHGFEDELVIPQTIGGVAVTAIASYFSTYGYAPRIVLPEGVTTIEREAFKGAIGLREIVLPGTLVTIDERAFQGCGLTGLDIPGSVQRIEFAAFMYAFVPEATVTFNSGDIELVPGSFYGTNMGRIDFNVDSCPTFNAGGTYHTALRNYYCTFDQCLNLYFMTMPEGVDMPFPSDTFFNTPRLTWIENIDSIKAYSPTSMILGKSGPLQYYYDKGLFLLDGSYLCTIDEVNAEAYPCLDEPTFASNIRIAKVLYSDAETLVIPEQVGGFNVTGIGLPGGYGVNDFMDRHASGGYGFTDDVTKLHHLTLPTYLRHITSNLFEGADLYDVNLSELPQLNYIGERAFYKQRHLTSELTFQAANCIVMPGAFGYCDRIPAVHFNNTQLYDDCFSYCFRLNTVDGTWLPRWKNNYYVRYFHLVPAFPVSKVYTHVRSSANEATENLTTYDYRVDRDYCRSAVTNFGRGKVINSFRLYITYPYVYMGTPEEAFITQYIGTDDTELYFPSEIYNETLGKTFRIKGVFCSDYFVDSPSYTVEFEEGIVALGKQALLDQVKDNWSGFVHIYDEDGHLAEQITWWGIDYFDENGNQVVDLIGEPEYIEEYYHLYIDADNSGAHFPRATSYTIPDSVIDAGKVFYGTQQTAIELPAETVTVSGVGDCPNLEQVTFRGNKLTKVKWPAFGGCPNLLYLDFGTSPLVVWNTAVCVADDAVVRMSPNTESIGGEAFGGSEVIFPGHSTRTPLLLVESNGGRNDPDYEDLDAFLGLGSNVTTIRCYEGSKMDTWAKAHFAGTVEYLPETSYRLVELVDDETDENIPFCSRPVDPMCENVVYNMESIEWYDLTAGNAHVGSGKEIQGDAVLPSHRYLCRITLASRALQNYYVDKTIEVILEPGESFKEVRVQKRPTWRITGTLLWWNYLDSRSRQTIYYGVPGLAPKTGMTRSAAIDVTVKASDDLKLVYTSHAFEDIVIEHLSDPDGDGLIDLGEINPTRKATPLLNYKFVGVLPDTTQVETIDLKTRPVFENLTTGKTMNGAYLQYRNTDWFVLNQNEVSVGDVIRVTYDKNGYTSYGGNTASRYTWTDSATFQVQYEDGDGLVYVPVEENANVTVRMVGAEFLMSYTNVTIIDEDIGKQVADTKLSQLKQEETALYLPDGSYKLVAKHHTLPAYNPDPAYSQYDDSSYYIRTFDIAEHQDRTFSFDTEEIPRKAVLKAKTDFVTDVIVGIESLNGDYVPLTFVSELNENTGGWYEKEKVVEFSYVGESVPAPFLVLSDRFAWYSNGFASHVVDAAYVPAEGFGNTTATVRYTGSSAKFTVYVPYKLLMNGYNVRMTCEDIVYFSKQVSVEGVTGDSPVRVSRLSPCASVLADEHTVTVETDELLADHYIQVYADGVLLEDAPGCGYVSLYHKTRSRTIVFSAANKGVGTSTRYTVALCDSPDKRLDFVYGEPREHTAGDYLHYETQTVTYTGSDLFGTYAKFLDIRFVQFNKEGFPHNSSGIRAYFDENNKCIGYSEKNGLLYTVVPHFMNPDGTFGVKVAYYLTLRLVHPENVIGQTVTMSFTMGNGNVETVLLKYNALTGSFEGVMELEQGVYTPDTLIESYKFDYKTMPLYDYTFDLSENNPSITGDIAERYARLAETMENMQELRDAYSAVDADKVEQILTQISGTVAPETVEFLRASAAAKSEYHAIVEKFFEDLQATMASYDDFGTDGTLKDPSRIMRETVSHISGAKEVVYTKEYLAQNGYVPQTTEQAGTVYVRYVDGNVLLYYPDMAIEVEADLSADKLPIGNTYDAPELTGLFGPGYSDHWEELDDDYTELQTLVETVGSVENLGKKIIDYVGLALGFLGEIIDVAVKYQEFQTQYNADHKALDSLDAATMKELEKALGIDKKYLNFSSNKELIEFMGKYVTDNATIAKLQDIRTRLSAEMDEMTKAMQALSNVSKGGVKAAKALPNMLIKGTHAVLSTIDHAISSPATTIAFTAFDLVDSFFSVQSALVSLASNLNANLIEVGYAWKYRQGDVSEDCKEECEDLRKWLGRYRLVYWNQFRVVCEGAIITLTGDVLSSLCILKGTAALVYGVSSFTLDSLENLGSAIAEAVVISMVDYCWNCVVEECGKPDNDDDDDDDDDDKLPHRKHIDPAGYVYEAVGSNRIEGATVTAYYKNSGGSPTLWDASEAEQINPLITGTDGAYQWFTPMGDWLVMAEKSGYHTATSLNDPEAVDGWLPVPPPQMNVNLGMISLAAPTVADVDFSGREIRVLFSQYMDIAALEANAALVTVKKYAAAVPVEFDFRDREASPADPDVYYGRTLYITPADGYDFNSTNVNLTISGDFANYAGTPIGATYQSGALERTQIPATIEHSYPNRLVTDVGDETAIAVRLLDTNGDPVANREVSVSYGFDLYEMPLSVFTDATGRAVFDAETIRSGYDVLTFTCEDAVGTLNTYVNPIGTEKPDKPTANLSDFETVASGTQLVLSCATEGSVIRYTLDDTCPCEDEALTYTGPITITEDTFVRIAAWTETGGYSERLNLHILCEKADELCFYGASLTLQNNLKVNFYVEKDPIVAAGYTDLYAKFEMNGSTVTVSDCTEVTSQGVRYYVFSFKDIAPNKMNDAIKASLHGTKGAKPCVGEVLTYSVAAYCYSKLSDTDNAELRTLLVDLLNYGAASQTYTDYKTDALANAALTAAQSAWGTAADPVLTSVTDPEYRTVSDPEAEWAGVSLKLNDSVMMQFVFTAANTDGLTVRVESVGGTVLKEIPAEDLVSSAGYYVARYRDLTAGQMSDTVLVTVYRGSEAVSNTVAYSVESYACAKQNDADADLASLVKAMMKYGNAAYAYVH